MSKVFESAQAPVSVLPVSDASNPLSLRELEILKLISEGYSNIEIASMLYLSISTVKSHTRNIFSKLGVTHRTQAAVFAIRHQLI
ncbi:response regulator transcription factor [Phormidium tenue FACHB-886]|nr:response regulator transcription factor [Phormidium tenue FACHB-886]